jgi:serpin B
MSEAREIRSSRTRKLFWWIGTGAVAILLFAGGMLYQQRRGVGNDHVGATRAPETTSVTDVADVPSAEPAGTTNVSDASDTPTTDSAAPRPVDEAAALSSAVQAGTGFAIDLHKILLKDNRGNQFFSPYSVSTILGLTAAGARATTAAEMMRMLHIPDMKTIHPGIARLTRDLLGNGADARPYQLYVANSLWESAAYPLLPSFTALAGQYYDTTGAYAIDFAANPEAARARINEWSEEKTKTRVKDLLPPGSIDRLTALVLANAIYFKGDWQTPFDARLTRTDAFHATPVQDVEVSLMRAGGNWQYFEDEDVQVVSLPFAIGKEAASPNSLLPSMLLILPRKLDGLSDLEKELRPELFARWSEGLELRSGQIFLPKFTLAHSIDLKDALKDLGMVEAFDRSKADFRALATSPAGDNIYISGVYHKAFVDVNEAGVEAAAATAVVAAGGGPRPNNPFLFRADHPFLFAIRMEPSNAILFLGRMVDPKPPAPIVADNTRGRGTRGERGQRGVRGRGPQASPLVIASKDARAAATAALELVATTKQDSEFVSPQMHTGLWVDLSQIESAANALLSEDSFNQVALDAASSRLGQALTQAFARAADIASRGSERQENRDKSVRLQQKLRDLSSK